MVEAVVRFFEESQPRCFATRLDKLITTSILSLDMADCIISLFPTHMEQPGSRTSVGNSSYVARVAFWDYIFRGVQEEEPVVLINESGRWGGKLSGSLQAMMGAGSHALSHSPASCLWGQSPGLWDLMLSDKSPFSSCAIGVGSVKEGERMTRKNLGGGRKRDKDIW